MPLFDSLFQSKGRRLLDLRKSGDVSCSWSISSQNEWQEKAVRVIIKNLTKNIFVDELEKAVCSENVNSCCITIPRSVSADSTFELNGLLYPPPVIACQFWRWPTLQSIHELRGTGSCQFSFASDKELICVNPFHYERIQSPTLPPIFIPRNNFNPAYSGMDASTNIDNGLRNQYNPNLPSPAANVDFPGWSNNEAFPIFMDHSGNGNCSSMETSVGMVKQEAGSDAQPIVFQEPEYWCRIIYYELGRQVGAFDAKARAITIDGYMDPSSSDRLCLGHFSNPERTSHVEQTRQNIGRGVKLWYIGGEVYVECLSQFPIWLQSLNCNQRFGWDPNAVVKVPPGCNLNLFSNREFAKSLEQAVHRGYDEVYKFATGACSIRLSFAKGWGADYKRQRVTECDCWTEIHLNGPFQWLDRVLRAMGSSVGPCPSMS